MKAGRLRNRVEFRRPVEMTSPLGEAYRGWETVARRWADYIPQRGREQLEAGRLQSEVPGTLQVRFDSVTKDIAAEYRVMIDGVEHQIRSVMDPDMRRRTIEMVVERGVAV
jgi:SPP1 family predicted phage head-tail adaptor